MKKLLNRLFPERSKARLLYHKVSALAAAIRFGFPSQNITVIGVTGTSGKSTTVELIHSLLQGSGQECGALSTIQFHIGAKTLPNISLRTTLRPWETQKMLRKMVKKKCKYAVIEVSSHALDQHRVDGINIDIAVLTNVSENEHLDYHGTFADYVRTKRKMFESVSISSRKASIPKQFVLNADDPLLDQFSEIIADRTWTFARRSHADVRASDVQQSGKNTKFSLRLPNGETRVTAAIVGEHNLQNVLTAIAVTQACNISVDKLADALANLPGIPGRLESIDAGQDFGVLVDFSYKPSALGAVLSALRSLTPGRIIVVWGGAGGRAKTNWAESAKIIAKKADEFVLTTDDPYTDDPKKIATHIRKNVGREEGDRFFEIEDRYEAIRYATYTAQPGDTVLIAGRGHEQMQTIGKQKIQFDDREVAREILAFALDKNLLQNAGES